MLELKIALRYGRFFGGSGKIFGLGVKYSHSTNARMRKRKNEQL